MLFAPDRRGADLVLEGRVLDPTRGIDESLRIVVEEGVIARIEPGSPERETVIAPAFVDPHVHLRTPGREDEETIASGTLSAAAGGYCAILAMPNTEPVVDSTAVLGALVERARDEAVVPTGFLAAISKGQRGEELTEMGELADAGAAGFTDDGRPVVSAGLLRRALQYSAVAKRPLALHCEEPTLSHGGHMHEGAVSAELGVGGWPSIAESVMVGRDLAIAAFERRPLHLMHLSARESVELARKAQADGVHVSAEVTPHHLCLTDEVVRSLDPDLKMNPPVRADQDRRALVEALAEGVIGAIATDHAPHARHEKDAPFEEAPFGVTGLETAFAALHTHLVVPGSLPLVTLLERMSAGPARIFGLPVPQVAVGERANLVALDLEAEWRVGEHGFCSLSANSWCQGATLRGKVLATVADGTLVWGQTPKGSVPSRASGSAAAVGARAAR
jgi:dihydroorotase